MAKARVINNIRRDGVEYAKGDTIEADKSVIAELTAAGAVEDPDHPETTVDTSELDDAKEQAKDLVKAAEKALNDAKADAERIVTEANAEAAKAKEDAATVAADAKADAERIVKDAQDAAAKAAQPKQGNQSK